MRPNQKLKAETELTTNNSAWGSSDFLMLFTVIIWGVNLTIVKLALQEFPPHLFNLLRLFGASLFLLFFLLLRRESLSLSRSELLWVIFLGFLGNTFYQVLFIQGISLTTASNASLIMTSSPLFIALLSTWLGHEKLSREGWLGLFLSLVGLYLVITQRTGGLSFSSRSLRGDLMILLGNLGWAGYTIFSRPRLKNMSSLKLAALTMVSGMILYLPFGLPQSSSFSFSAVSWQGWAEVSFSFIFALGLGFVVWYNSLRYVGNSRTGIYSYLTPLVAIITAHLALAERITWLQGLGGLIILFGFSLTRAGLWWHRPSQKPLSGSTL